MYAKLIITGASVLAALFLTKDDKKTETEDNDQTVLKTDSTIKYSKLRRGDRFICPDTGEELQIRAVGGRPKKSNNISKVFQQLQ